LAGVSPARRLLRDRAAVAFGLLFLLLALAFFAAPLYASAVAHTTFSESRLSEQMVLDGEATYIVSLVGVPIGPTWEGSYFLGADEIGRDLMVRLLYGGRNSLVIGASSSCGRRCSRRWTRSGSGRRARRACRRSA
jgi:peptide/nickel transport system permease protein